MGTSWSGTIDLVKSRRNTTFQPIGKGVQALIIVVVMTATFAATIGLLWLVGKSPTREVARLQLDAVRIALSFGAGTGGAVALWLAIRRQRATEHDLVQKEEAAQYTEYDADKKRATELYGKAAEQLASESVTVRLAGVYALEMLANEHPDLQQTVVSLFCAQLRTLAGSRNQSTAQEDKKAQDGSRSARSIVPRSSAQHSERNIDDSEIMETILGIISLHVKSDPDRRTSENWTTGLHLNLKGAKLSGIEFEGAELGRMDLSGACVEGPVNISDSTLGELCMDDAQLYRTVRIDLSDVREIKAQRSTVDKLNITRSSVISLNLAGSSCREGLELRSVNMVNTCANDMCCSGNLVINHANVKNFLSLSGITLRGNVYIRRSTFGTITSFDGAEFNNGHTVFEDTNFGECATLSQCHFGGDVHFSGDSFGKSGAVFKNCTFEKRITFEDVTFGIRPDFSGSVITRCQTERDEFPGEWIIVEQIGTGFDCFVPIEFADSYDGNGSAPQLQGRFTINGSPIWEDV